VDTLATLVYPTVDSGLTITYSVLTSIQTTRLLYNTARQLLHDHLRPPRERVSLLFTHSGRSVVEAGGLYTSVLREVQ